MQKASIHSREFEFGKLKGGGNERRQSLPASQRASKKSSSETGTVGIRQVKYNPRWESPCVTGFSPRPPGNVTLMIDTSAEVSLLKKDCNKPLTKIDGTDLLQLTGITLKKQSTLGTLIIRIFGEDVLFHVVDENFPIHFDGILGMDFLGSRSTIINNTLGCLNFKNMGLTSVSIARTFYFDNVRWQQVQTKLDLVHKIRCSLVIARQKLVRAKIRSKVYFDRKACGQNLIVGQSVYILKHPTSKLGNQYTGPHQILDVLSKNNIKISCKNRTKIVHKDKVKSCAK
ncbi:hypothetical protein M0804_013751 [Polistes exclamans]|nr:hypothetical protein M0804_013751 [Polistes exclamans]